MGATVVDIDMELLEIFIESLDEARTRIVLDFFEGAEPRNEYERRRHAGILAAEFDSCAARNVVCGGRFRAHLRVSFPRVPKDVILLK